MDEKINDYGVYLENAAVPFSARYTASIDPITGGYTVTAVNSEDYPGIVKPSTKRKLDKTKDWKSGVDIIESNDIVNDLGGIGEKDVPWKSRIKTNQIKKPKLSHRIERELILRSLKEQYSIEECLLCFDEFCKKDFNEIYLTGSVALYLQDKISRTYFKDLDVIIIGEYELDDDIYENPFACNYPPDPNGTSRIPVAFNNVKMDLFTDVKNVNIVECSYEGKKYLCQDYRDIIKAKINMILPKMKDSEELLGSCFEINFI